MSKLLIHPHYGLSFLKFELLAPEPNRLADYIANGDWDLHDYEIVASNRYQLDHEHALKQGEIKHGD